MVMGSPAELKKSSRQGRFKLAEKSHLSSRGITTAELRSKLNKNDGKQTSVNESPRRNFPRYLGEPNVRENVQDKSSNFGLFDWGSLEKRKYERTRVPLRGGDVRSSLIVSDERRNSSSKERLSLPKEGGHYSVVHGKRVPHRQFVGKDHMGIKLEMGAREKSNSKVIPKNTEKLPKTRLLSSDSINGAREISKAQLKRRKDKLEESGFLPSADNYTNTLNTLNFVPHKDGGSLAEFEHSTSDYGSITRTNGHTFYDVAALSSDVPYSCPVPCEFQSNRWTDIDLSTPIGVEVTKNLYDGRHPLTNSDEKPDFQFKDKDEEYNKATVRPVNQIFAEPSDEMGKQEVENNAGFNRLNRVLSFKEATATPQLRSTSPSGKICSPVNNSNKNAANAQSRSRQSPLRRILNQVLKAKASNFPDERPSNLCESNTQEAPLRDPLTLAHTTHQLLASMSSSSTHQPMRRNLNFLHLAQDDKNMPSSTKAILQLVYKDGLPLFTFTSNKKGDILVARMMKTFTTGKDDFEWVYTFHTVPEAKKNTVGWINQGTQCKKYVPTITGHMKVLCSQCPKQAGKGSEDSVSVKEFVLYGAKITEAAHEDLNFLPNNELAAIVVTSEKHQSDNNDDISKTKSLQNASSVVCRDPSSRVTVIVPSGVHGLPVVGLPSPLIDRWRSGGSCDCGGWDLGCMLTIFIGQDRQNLNSSQPYFSSEATHLVDLSVQGGQQENKHALSFSAFKEWIYSVNISAPISSLQAFSICVAILHGKIATGPAEIFRSVEAKTSAVTMLAGGKKNATSITQGEVPASYILFPPLSPVGRV